MAKPIGFTELMKRLANKSKVSEKTVRKVYDNLFLLVSEELRFSGTVRLKRFGTFTIKQSGGKDRIIPKPDGSFVSMFVEPYYNIKFKPSGEFINYINGRLVDKESKKRERNGTLTKNEKALQKLKVEDNERNLDIALERLAKEINNGKR